MSRLARSDVLARISDATLGAFTSLPPSEALNHLIRFLSTWSGTELRVAHFFSCFPLTSARAIQQAIHGVEPWLRNNALEFILLFSSSSTQ